MTETTVPPAASDRVAAHLRAAILGGEIRPGERVRQEEVAQLLGSSRLPVREALHILEAEGLIEHEANKGARVPRLSSHDVDTIYQMRERLEPLRTARDRTGSGRVRTDPEGSQATHHVQAGGVAALHHRHPHEPGVG